MSEIRTNPFTGEMSLYAENRRNRPYEFVHNTERKHANSEKCPFCGGHEAWTPDAIYQDGPNGAWQMRVFPNKFPTVREDCTDAAEEPFYTQTAGRGRHEILVDTPDHDATIDTFDARISQAFCRYYRIGCIFSAIVQIRSMCRFSKTVGPPQG